MAGIAGQLGPVALAAHGVFMMTATLFYLAPLAIADSTSTLTGNFLGAGFPESARNVVMLGIICDFLWGLLAGSVLFFLLRPYWASLFTSDDDVRQLIYAVIPVMFCYITVDSMKCIVLVILRSTGRPTITAWGNILSCLLIMLPLGWYFGVHLEFGLVGIWASMTVGWFSAMVIYLYTIYKTDWNEQVRLAQERNSGEIL